MEFVSSKNSALRVPPQNIDAEKSVLGSIMIDPNAIYVVVDILHPEDFYTNKNGLIYETMLELNDKKEAIDILTLSARLSEKRQLEAIGGKTYLSEIVNSVPTAANAKHYAELVYKKSVLRNLIESSNHISQMGYEEENELDEVLDTAEKKIFGITRMSLKQRFLNVKHALEEAWDRIDRLHKNKGELRGVPTGFKDMDSKLAGFQKADLIILAARPSMGKTALALDIARHVACRQSVPVGIFSLEMSSQQLVDRLLAAEAHVDSWKLRTGQLSSEDEFGRLQDAMSSLATAPIYIDDEPSNNIMQMRAMARRLQAEHGLGLIIVDYLQLMVPRKPNDSTVQQITEISRALKGLARELNVPVLALSQLSRAVEQRGGRPRLSDLRDSGCLSGDTLLTRADTGEQVAIKNLVGQTNIPILSVLENKKLSTQIISKVFSSGVKKLFEIKTRSGRSIKASTNHKFFTLSGWKRLDELGEKVRIGIPRILRLNTQSTLNNDELILLPHLLGDGCVLPKQAFHYTSADEANLDVVSQTAKRLFGITSRLVKQKNWWHLYLPSPYPLARGKKHPITLWFEKLGLSLERSYNKVIPQDVFQGSEKQISLFLHHLWATDGNISWKYLPGRKPSAAIYYSSTSKKLADGVQHLLLRLGILSTMKIIPQGKHRLSYQIHIQGASMQISFLEKVGNYGERGVITPELIEALKKITPNTNTDTIPTETWEMIIQPEKELVGMSWRGFAESMGAQYNGTALRASGISRTRLVNIANVMQSQTIRDLATSDIYWDEIVAIAPLGEEEVFDATVPETHNFVAGDFIVHNSIEQDADVVMFIHREDKHKAPEDRTNIVEVLIEKHRNGPTGKVELYFTPEKVSFSTLEKTEFSEL